MGIMYYMKLLYKEQRSTMSRKDVGVILTRYRVNHYILHAFYNNYDIKQTQYSNPRNIMS